jgi:hypothetical protein
MMMLVFFEPTSIPKAKKLFERVSVVDTGAIKCAFPNEYELQVMFEAVQKHHPQVMDQQVCNFGIC